VIHFFKFIFYISALLIIILSLYPGNLIGFMLYKDLSAEPNLAPGNPFGPSLNHFFVYLYLALLGLFIYLNAGKKKFKRVVFALFLLSAILEILQFIVPIRAFELYDLIFNILGVTVAYCIIKIYLFIINR